MMREEITDAHFKDMFIWIRQKTGISFSKAYKFEKNANVMGVVPDQGILFISNNALENMTEDEIKSILLHEAGHMYRSSILWWKNKLEVLTSFVSYYLVSYLLVNYMGWTEWTSMSQILAWYFFIGSLIVVISFVVGLPFIIWGRHEEYMADEFAVRHMGEASSFSRAMHKVTNYVLQKVSEMGIKISSLRVHPTTKKRIARAYYILNK